MRDTPSQNRMDNYSEMHMISAFAFYLSLHTHRIHDVCIYCYKYMQTAHTHIRGLRVNLASVIYDTFIIYCALLPHTTYRSQWNNSSILQSHSETRSSMRKQRDQLHSFIQNDMKAEISTALLSMSWILMVCIILNQKKLTDLQESSHKTLTDLQTGQWVNSVAKWS